ncbi:hypothetical protein B9Z55_027335 [Caenorhabditis nigoni]|uniref:DUF38 domain-containing protein n=1 Tax=Caenorhabditis nigoni TaxID=1611254 RepID=A0A2G5SGJ1_9PELO|nr:hypothetical protein B9Z55_027335 [Caenorhabditis nigoni]
MLEKLNRRIKTKEWSLQFADPETPKILSICIPMVMEMASDEIVKTEQWKKAAKFECNSYCSNLNLEDICRKRLSSVLQNSRGGSSNAGISKKKRNYSIWKFF